MPPPQANLYNLSELLLPHLENGKDKSTLPLGPLKDSSKTLHIDTVTAIVTYHHYLYWYPIGLLSELNKIKYLAAVPGTQ